MGEAAILDVPDASVDRPLSAEGRKRTNLMTATALFIVVILVLATFVLVLPDKDAISINGDFTDWDDVPKFTDILEGSENADIDITEYAVKDNEDSLNFYVKVKGRMLAGKASDPGADSVQVFLDTDRRSDTGYQVYGTGADHMVNITGWGGDAHTALHYAWEGLSGTDLMDFIERDDVDVATSGSDLEAEVMLSDIDVPGRDTPVRTVIRTVDSLGHEDWADAAVNQFPPALAFMYISGQNSNQFSLSALAHHDNITLDRLTIRFEDHRGFPASGRATISVGGKNYQGTGPSATSVVTFTPPLAFAPGVTQTFQVSTQLQGAVAVRPGLLYSSDIEARSEDHSSVEVSVKPSVGHTYVNTVAPPRGSVRIDGNFDDWMAFGMKGEGTGDVKNRAEVTDSDFPYSTNNRNVDINGYQVKATPTSGPSQLSFMVSTAGRMLNGLVVDDPRFPGIQFPGMGGGEPPENLFLQDRVIIYIDIDPTSDPDAVTGIAILPDKPTFGADYFLDIHGKSGRVIGTLSKVYQFQLNQGWRELTGTVNAAADYHRVEAQITLGTIGMDPSVTPETFIVTTDWNENYDETQPYLNR